MKNSVSSSEWTFVVSILLIMISLVIIAKINKARASFEIHSLVSDEQVFPVTVMGAVKRPGCYMASSETILEDVVQKAKPKRYANLKEMPLKKIVEGPLVIKVEEVSQLQIHIHGAVEKPVTIIMPIGSRICDLKRVVNITEEADKSFFRRKKLLRDGDQICVPKKTVEQNSAV